MTFIHHNELPTDRKATYLRVVADIRPHKEEKLRVRFTVDGDKVDYPGAVSSLTADLATVKCLLNKVVSTPGAKFMSLDITDLYLGSIMERPEIHVDPKQVYPRRH